jgi:soluble lytic murein transglycosylase-like protein
MIGASRSTGSGRRAALGLCVALPMFACCLAPVIARAQVIEIAADGSTETYARPAIFTADGAKIIAPDLEAAAPAQPYLVRQLIAEAAGKQRLNPDLLTELAWRESRFRQDAVSSKDAVGLMQLTAGTAQHLGVDRYDLRQNIHGGAVYLRTMLDRYGGDVRLALAAYNAGPGAVDRYRGVPPYAETQAYVATIMSRLARRTPGVVMLAAVP